MSWDEWIDARNDAVRAGGRWRSPVDLEGTGPVFMRGGRKVVSFASNDYLGLVSHPAVRQAAHDAIDRSGVGAGSARLVVGSRPVHSSLEAALAEWKGMPAAVLFPTGYAANLGVLSALATPDVLVCSDELNHASIVDGCRLARARGASVCVYPHRDLSALETALATSSPQRAVVVSDSVFSMDGDAADVDAMRELCEAHGALLLLDEAHAVWGPHVDPGPGVVRIGTLSKMLGALGGFVAAAQPVVDLIVNTARPYIFTTASTPADAAAALAALSVFRSPEGAQLRATLRRHLDRVAGSAHPSPIVPIVLGSEETAVRASAALLAEGLLVPAIRPPTVPPGTARLRVTLSAAHTDDQVSELIAALAGLRCDRSG